MCVFVGAQDSLGLLEPFNGDMTDKAQSTAQANCGLESDTSHSAQIFQGDKTRWLSRIVAKTVGKMKQKKEKKKEKEKQNEDEEETGDKKVWNIMKEGRKGVWSEKADLTER